jgi:hypothetical protein
MASLSIDQLLNTLDKAARGKHQSVVNAKDFDELGRFVAYLINVEGKKPQTAEVYKSLVAKALALGADRDNPGMMSAVRALGRFRAGQS